MNRIIYNIVAVTLVAIVLGAGPALAQVSGPIVGWGDNSSGQLNVPSPNSGFVAIAAGSLHSLGLKNDGPIVVWGSNGNGQLNLPSPNSGFTAIAAGAYHSLGLKSDGSIVAWGDNSIGQLNVPAPNTDFASVAAGLYHSLGLKSDGSIVAWGNNGNGQINVPAPNSGFIAVAAGFYHSLGLKNDGSIVKWGFMGANVPAPNSAFTAVAGGWVHSLGLKSDGSIVAWGQSDVGQLNVPAPNSSFVAVSAGNRHSLGLKYDGSIRAWGWNFYGQLILPTPNSGFIAIAAGHNHSLALKSSCAVDLMPDCNGNCAPANWIGDDVCDNGSYSYNGQPIYFNCQQFGNDGGDCNSPPPLPPPAPHTPPAQPPPPSPPQPMPQERNLLFITHGAGTTQSNYQQQWQPLEPLLESLLDDSWQVWMYDWSPTIFPHNLLGYPPGPALTRARQIGDSLGQGLDWSNYDHVHFVAHSAGSLMISRLAHHARLAKTPPTVHLTYLDAYVLGVINIDGDLTWLSDYYGEDADWSDQYTVYDALDLVGELTFSALTHSHNVNVSTLDPDYQSGIALSSHGWPICFWLHSMTQHVKPPETPDCSPCTTPSACPQGGADAYNPYGYHLSKEWLGAAWNANTLNSTYPRGGMHPPSNNLDGAEQGSDFVYRIREDALLNPLGGLYSSSGANVSVGSSGFASNTTGTGHAGSAWITMQIQTTNAVNFVRYQADFTSAVGAEGLLTAYVNGEEVGSLDERFADEGVNYRVAMLAEDLAAGTHTIAFRLDQFGTVPSSATVNIIGTGYGGFFGRADITMDGVVGVPDLLTVINAWGQCGAPPAECPADIAPPPNGDGTVGVPDLLMVINNWG